MRWLILTLIVLSFACSKKEAAAPAEPEQSVETEAPAEASAKSEEQAAEPTETEPAAEPEPKPELPEALKGETPAISAPPVVELLEPGKEPRTVLRSKVAKGFEQKLTAEVGYALEAIVVIMKVASPRTLISYDLTMRARKIEDDGTVRVAFTVDRAAMDASVSAETEDAKSADQMKEMTRVTGSYAWGPHGGMTDLDIQAPPDASVSTQSRIDGIRWALTQMIPAFPKEPVGEGAKWTVHEGVLQGGVHVNQLTTMELVKVKGSRVELALTVRQTAAEQPYTNPDTGASMTLLTLDGDVIGSLTWDLSELAPRAADIDLDLVTGTRQVQSDSKRKVDIAVFTDRTVKVTPKK
ncbi:MAG: hypothetical protein AMJ62_10320 [Myxococcales bacterium SG8_38]|nr:MAG: hypothetical protein AMJ62_10320 [Myxococcales bacterium SG8_38]